MAVIEQAEERRKIDVQVQNAGSIVLLHLRTPSAKDWVLENISDDAQFLGHALAVEPRYVADIIDGMTEAGLSIN